MVFVCKIVSYRSNNVRELLYIAICIERRFDNGNIRFCKEEIFVVLYMSNKKNTFIINASDYTGTLWTFVILFSFYNYDSYIYTSGYKIIQKNFLEQILIDFYRFIIGLVGSIFILLVLYRITKHIKGIKKIIIYIGQNTFGVYIISQFVFSYVINRITYNLPGINYLVIILETIFILSFSLLCTRIIKYSKLLNRLLLGGR